MLILVPSSGCESLWTPPNPGTWKVNFDVANLNGVDHGWGVMVRESEGDIVLARVCPGTGFLGSELKEARVCYFALKTAFSHGVRSIILEGDCKSLITKLKRKCVIAAEVGLFINDIFQFSYLFYYCAFEFVKREGSRVAHYLPHLQTMIHLLGFGLPMSQITSSIWH